MTVRQRAVLHEAISVKLNIKAERVIDGVSNGDDMYLY